MIHATTFRPPLSVMGVYAFLHGRLGAHKGRLLRARDWERLSEARSFAEQQRLLVATSYRPWVAETLDGTLRSLGGALHQAARAVEWSVPPEGADFIRAWARRDLLRNLKTILKGKALGRAEDEIRSELLDLKTSPPLPITALLRAASVESALDLLENTELRPREGMGAAAVATTDLSTGRGIALLGVAVATGLAVLGAGHAVGTVGAAALGVITEKPEMLGRTLVFIGLAEGLAIYGLILSILLLQQLR